MNSYITSFFTASALGVGNEETLANLAKGVAPGMHEISGDILTRSIWFGSVPGELPVIRESRDAIRANQLLELAISRENAFANLVAKYGADRVGIVLGASNTGIDEAQNFVDTWLETGNSEPPEGFDFSMIELGTPTLYLKSRLGVLGPAYTVSTACSSATKAFASASRLIENGICDAVITGGVDGRCRFAMNGFHALGALSEGRCRPLAPDRDGINLGEAVALFAIEKEGDSLHVASVGETSDAYHATAPDPSGAGAARAMRLALENASLPASAIDYLNMHGTGTRANDDMELLAMREVFGENLPRYESTKNLTGHCLGAAGAVEAAICALKILSGECRVAMSNSFAFGGSNASIILSA